MGGGGHWSTQSIFLRHPENYLVKLIQLLLNRNKEGKHTDVRFIIITRQTAEEHQRR